MALEMRSESRLTQQVLRPRAKAQTRRASARTQVLLGALSCVLLAAFLPLTFANILTASGLALCLACACVTGAVVGALASMPRTHVLGVWLAVAAAAISVIVLVAVGGLRAELFGFVNALISSFNDAFSAYVPLIVSADAGFGSPAFNVLLGVLFGAIMALAFAIHTPRALALFAAVVAAATLCIGCGWSVAAVCCAVAGLVLMLRAAQLEGAAGSLGFMLGALAALCAVCAAVALALGFLLPSNAAPSPAARAISSAITQLRYGSDTLAEGDLAAASSMNEGTEERLAITAQGSTKADVLFKGFVGAAYDGSSWQALDHNAYEGDWTGLFAWLAEQDYNTETIRSSFNEMAEEQKLDACSTLDLEVDASNANRRYVYAPYTLDELEGTSWDKSRDGSLLASGWTPASSYEMSAVSVASDDGIQDAAWLAGADADSAFMQADAVYRAFVEDNYLDVSTEDAELINKLIFNDASFKAGSDNSVYTVVSRVRTMLSMLASYTTTPQTLPADTDFLPWFLQTARAGNSAYFATAAVLAFRAQGIPARYVEGYRAKAAEVNKGNVTLTAEDAHAWVEIYREGYGWVAVEVTPGFYEQAAGMAITEVDQPISTGAKSGTTASSAVGGEVEQSAQTSQNAAFNPVLAAVIAAALLIVALALILALAFVRRNNRVRQRDLAMATIDQSVAVPALYRHLSTMLKASNIDFDEGKPLESTQAVCAAYPEIDAAEYERAIRLCQDQVFGGKKLRAHEMRALRSFVGRVEAGLPKPKGLRERFKRFFISAL